jgi:F0F1-type ATP synthase assembly protein I
VSSGDVRGPQSNNDRQGAIFGVVLATTVAQVGCVTVIVILGALALGLALDNWLDTRPLFTLVLMLLSIPLSLYLLVRVALSSTQQLTPSASRQAKEESSREAESPDREV